MNVEAADAAALTPNELGCPGDRTANALVEEFAVISLFAKASQPMLAHDLLARAGVAKRAEAASRATPRGAK